MNGSLITQDFNVIKDINYNYNGSNSKFLPDSFNLELGVELSKYNTRNVNMNTNLNIDY